MMTIDVLIPSYNRSQFLKYQVRSLRTIRDELIKFGMQLNVVISDNQSNPAVSLPDDLKSFATIHKPAVHLPTAEENAFFGMEKCTAEFVWLLGDDDAPIVENVIELFKELQRTKADFILGNASGSMVNGSYLKSRTSCSEPSQISGLPDFIQRTGLNFVIAGFSCLIFKREPLVKNRHRFQPYFEVSKIYSLVFWFIDTFWDAQFQYYNRPLVIYKQNATDVSGQHWPNTAVKFAVFRNYFWTLGFVRHAKILRKAKSIPYGYFSKIIDQSWHHRYLYIASSISMFLEQLETDLRDVKQKSRTVTRSEVEEYIDFVSSEDGRYLDIFVYLDVEIEQLTFQRLKLARHELHKHNSRFFQSFYVKKIYGWDIYHFDRVYRAIPEHFNVLSINELFMDIAPLSSETQLISTSLYDLENLLKLRPYPLKLSLSQNHHEVSLREVIFLKKLIKLYEVVKRIYIKIFGVHDPIK